MNKILFVLLSLYALPTADLLAAEVTEATPEQQSTLDLPVEVLDAATSKYAKALMAGDHVPDDAMEVVHAAHVMRDKRACDSIIQKIMLADGSKRIHLPNAIPPFLCEFVTDKTSAVYDMINNIIIDKMSLNPHIKEHMKHSVGRYYESKEDKWATGFKQDMRDDLRAMAKQYTLLDAIEKDATLKDVQFIVIPDVGNTDVAITNRWEDLDTLFKKHPHLTLVVSFNDDLTRVGNGFCSDRLGTRPTLPVSIKKFSFTGKALTTVGDYFFYEASALASVDFRGLGALTTVGRGFFYDARSLTSVNLSGLRALTTVGHNFFYDARYLTFVDFRGLSALQTVGDDFFSGASALTLLDLSGLGALQTVGNGFFSHAYSLTSVNLKGLSALQTIGNLFFSEARSLPSLDLRGLGALQTVGYYFFSCARSLTSVDLSGLRALTTVGSDFFYNACSLPSVDLRGLSALTTVGNWFFSHASALTSIFCHNEKQAQLIRDQYVGGAACISVVQHPAATDTEAVPASGNASTVG